MERTILSIRNIVYLALGTFVPGLVTWDAEATAPRPRGRPPLPGVTKRLLDQPLEWCASPSAYTS
jgi:hypothetical protein